MRDYYQMAPLRPAAGVNVSLLSAGVNVSLLSAGVKLPEQLLARSGINIDFASMQGGGSKSVTKHLTKHPCERQLFSSSLALACGCWLSHLPLAYNVGLVFRTGGSNSAQRVEGSAPSLHRHRG